VTAKTAVRYGNLSRNARDVIRFWYGDPVTIAGYIRYWSADGVWRGDSCGCPDDRCIGFHHDQPGDCHCLESTLSEYAVWANGCPACEQVVNRDSEDAVQVYDRNRFVLVWWHRTCAS
jgi:hypothetical protein